MIKPPYIDSLLEQPKHPYLKQRQAIQYNSDKTPQSPVISETNWVDKIKRTNFKQKKKSIKTHLKEKVKRDDYRHGYDLEDGQT